MALRSDSLAVFPLAANSPMSRLPGLICCGRPYQQQPLVGGHDNHHRVTDPGDHQSTLRGPGRDRERGVGISRPRRAQILIQSSAALVRAQLACREVGRREGSRHLLIRCDAPGKSRHRCRRDLLGVDAAARAVRNRDHPGPIGVRDRSHRVLLILAVALLDQRRQIRHTCHCRHRRQGLWQAPPEIKQAD